MLELKNITKSYFIGYNEQKVLKGVTVKFRRNEFTSILGASGSGKTTLLNIIGGLDKYNDGELLIDGNSTKQYSDRDWDSYRNYRVGFIFQSYNLIGHQSVLSNVEMALTLSGVSKSERKQRAKDALIKVGLEEHINKKPNQLSGGQMQRVAIARALVNDPEIILADEPTGALDSETSVQIMDLLKEVAQDKLVIMVTHNPEIAKKYSTRIIELKDGLIIKDSNPVKDKKESKIDKDVKKTSMSLLTSLGLSYNNLLTKMGRTVLTAIAGSIGIIGIALILSLTNGVNGFVKQMERESLTSYPITIEKDTVDLSKLFNFEQEEKIECEKGKVCSKNDLSSRLKIVTDGMVKKNDLSNFKKYIDENENFSKNATEITYGYNLDLQIFATNNIKINPNTFNVFSGIAFESEEVKEMMSSYTKSESVFTELLNNEEYLNEHYEVLAGTLPKEFNELVIIVSEDNIISDSVLYALDIKDRNELAKNLEEKVLDKNSSTTYSYEDLLNKSYKLVLQSSYYKKEHGIYVDYSNDYNYMKNVINNGLDVKVVGVLRAKKDATSNKVGYKHSLTEYVINEISKTNIYKDQTSNREINVLTGVKFSDTETTYEETAKKIGIAELDNPSRISIYPKDFDSKEEIISLIDKYNEEQKANHQEEYVIEYTDMLKALVNGITSIITIISIVLIGFVAISLIVSSIMISIITYISVLERTKEIGILRAIGASKKDVARVFIAETIIEGLFAGCLGIIVTILLCFPINATVSKLADISNIAALPIGGALFLIALSVLLNVIAGIIPAVMASKKDPVVALRSE